MENSTRLGRKLGRIMSRNGLTQLAFSQSADIANATVAKVRSYGMRPGPEMLKTLCNCPAIARADGVELLCEHLRDEIDRAGFLQDEIQISAGTVRPTVAEIDRDLDIIRDAVTEREDVRLLIHDLALVVRSLQQTEAPMMLKVAEEREPFGDSPPRTPRQKGKA